VCSGIEASTVAWHPLGWTPVFFSEIEAFPRAVLHHHYPEVPLHGDFTTIGADDYGAIDLLVGGTPCQSFSVAGLRGGLGDDRGNLALEFLRLADRKRPRWLVWENVPGVLSSNGGRDFGSILGGMVELGYGVAYRVLDAQFFGVPQRRRRVFVVGYFGGWRRAAAVLFERHSLSGHPAPRRQAGAIASALTRNGLGGGGLDDKVAQGGHLVVFGAQVESPFLEDVALPVTARNGDPGMIAFSHDVAPALTSNYDSSDTNAGPNLIAFSCKDHSADASEIAPTLRAMEYDGSHANGGGQFAVAFNTKESGKDASLELAPPLRAESGDPHMGGRMAVALTTQQEPKWSADLAFSLTADSPTGGGQRQCVATSSVRRLTPLECERLQGFPDEWTLVPHRGKPAADGPRYRALGNSMAVPCMVWLGERIALVDAIERAA